MAGMYCSKFYDHKEFAVYSMCIHLYVYSTFLVILQIARPVVKIMSKNRLPNAPVKVNPHPGDVWGIGGD